MDVDKSPYMGKGGDAHYNYDFLAGKLKGEIVEVVEGVKTVKAVEIVEAVEVVKAEKP